MSRRLLSLLLLLALMACGFEPVYQSHQGLDTRELLARVSVVTPPGRDGDQLKAALEDQFYQSLLSIEPRYQLIANLDIESREFIIDPDGISSRFDLILTSNYNIIRLSDELELDKGHIRTQISYNVSQENDYATYISQKDAKRRGIEMLANDYQQQLAAMFARQIAVP